MPNPKENHDKVHKTMKKGNENLSVLDVLEILKEKLLDKEGIEILILNKESPLVKIFGVYDFS